MGTEHILAAAQEASLPGVDVIESLVSLLTTHWLRDIDPPAPAPMSLVSGNIYVEWLVLSTPLSLPHMDNASSVYFTAAMFDQGSPSPVSPLSHLWLWPPIMYIRDSRSGVGTVAMFIFRGEQLGPGIAVTGEWEIFTLIHFP